MELVTTPTGPVELTTTPIHLGLGARALPVNGFAWQPDVLAAYEAAVAADGAEGRLVVMFEGSGSGTAWERHPAGDEVVVCLSGGMTVTVDGDGSERPVPLSAGEAMINPRGRWHVIDIPDTARFLTITPGSGTEHRPR